MTDKELILATGQLIMGWALRPTSIRNRVELVEEGGRRFYAIYEEDGYLGADWNPFKSYHDAFRLIEAMERNDFGWEMGWDGGDPWAAFVANPLRYNGGVRFLREEWEAERDKATVIAPDIRRAIVLAALKAVEHA